MKKMRNEIGALHMEVLHSVRGRVRVRLEKPIESCLPFERINGVQSVRYNPRIQTLLVHYDENTVTNDQLLIRLGAVYARLIGTGLLHIMRSEEKDYTMTSTSWLALGSIMLDGAMILAASPLTTYTRWISTAATLAAVVEHGYQELHTRGSFDPEVMSVVYLINSIGGTTNSVQACLIAWMVTFGRHLLPKAPREQVYLVHSEDRTVTLTPVQGMQPDANFVGSVFNHSMEVVARRG